MNAKPIDKLERQLQDLIEGAFARLFPRATGAPDNGILLFRAMEDNVCHSGMRGDQPVAPDAYEVFLHSESVKQFIARIPEFSARLALLIAELSSESGYQLRAAPGVSSLADPGYAPHQARVSAAHSAISTAKTAKMAAVSAVDVQRQPEQRPHLHLINQGAAPLIKSVINIGRESSNDVIISDAFVSRHHVQQRRCLGKYTLYDVNSRGGTLVNDTALSKRRLQNGDVIRIGHSDFVYADDYRQGIRDRTTRTLRQE
ncbi:MAG: DUF3662 domain-containing protein [Chloroflexi bacterium]|nr:DUF3662 domain-containing protein [Chloroflexota bacterium]